MRQTGAATLLMALVLMISATAITLAVARSHIVEQRISSNSNWHAQLRLAAEEGLARGRVILDDSITTLVWKSLPPAGYVSLAPVSDSGSADIRTEVVYIRKLTTGKFVTIQSTAQRIDNSGMQVRVSQQVRSLSVLAPAAENAPPLVLAGCLLPVTAGFHIRPVNADSDQAGEAVWTPHSAVCPFPAGIDIHQGWLRRKLNGPDLWKSVFSVSRQQFEALAAADQSRPPAKRRYWSVDPSLMRGGIWSDSVGSAKQPVVLYFPASNVCPEFGPGVQIHGLVFIDTDCPLPIGNTTLTIYGSLVVNGNLSVPPMNLQLNHIQQADRRLTGLEFPPLRNVLVPGTWKDF